MTLFVVISSLVALACAIYLAAPLLGSDDYIASDDQSSGVRDSLRKFIRVGSISGLGLMPILAGGVYLVVGEPGMIGLSEQNAEAAAPAASLQAAAAAMSPEKRQEMIEAMVQRLATRLENDPADLDGWRQLARSYTVLGRFTDSAVAWRKAISLSDGALHDWRGLAVSLLEKKDDGDVQVTPEIKQAL